MPHSPASIRRQVSSRVAPSAVTSPTPVMATRFLIRAAPAPTRRSASIRRRPRYAPTRGRPRAARAPSPPARSPAAETETAATTAANARHAARRHGPMIARAEARQRGDIGGDDAVGVAGHRGGRAVTAARPSQSLPQAAQKLLARAAGRLGPRGADAPQRVRVAAGDHAEPGESRGGVPSFGDLLHERIVRRQHRAVSRLERRHLVEQPQIRVERHLPAIEVQQMIQREEDVGLAQPRRSTSKTLRRSGCTSRCSASVMP